MTVDGRDQRTRHDGPGGGSAVPEQARGRLLRHLCGRLTGLLRQLCGGLNGVLEHNRRVREAQRRAREARRPWREEQAQVWFNLNQRYERMLEHNRRVREA